MNKKRILPIVGFLSLLLVGCNNSNTGSSSSSLSTSDGDSSSSNGGSSSKSDSSSSSEASSAYQDISFNGIVRFYYHDNSANYSNIALWIWADGSAGSLYTFNPYDSSDDFGAYLDFDMSRAGITSSLTGINFILRNPKNWSGQSNDTFAQFGKFSSTIEDIEGSDKQRLTVYFCRGAGTSLFTFSTKEAALGDFIKTASFASWNSIKVTGSGDSKDRAAADVGLVSDYKLYAYPDTYYALSAEQRDAVKENYVIQTGTPGANTFTITLSEDADLAKVYSVECLFPKNTTGYSGMTVGSTGLFDTDKFNTNYCYTGDDLGATWSDDGKDITFKLWAPTSSSVDLFLYIRGTPSALLKNPSTANDFHSTFKMTRGEKGVWSYTYKDFSTYHYYTYSLSNALGTVETIDPYAKAAGLNGVRGAILTEAEWDSTEPTDFNDDLKGLTDIASPADLTVYETHIRDFTADSSWISNKGNRNGTYNAFVEQGTTYTKDGVSVSTGFDSLKELGVSAVQLLPVFDQDNDERIWENDDGTYEKYPEYNWGYNPLNYNVVEGSYSSDPKDPILRIKEFKNLIDVLAKNDMRTIMDVVYNHMATISSNAFGKTVPEYYFMMDADSNYIDQTGVHNTFDSYRTMGSKFIVDSCAFWAEEYGIKGFRFDLMGCISSATMRAVKDALYEIDPEIVVYGEGWRGSGSSDNDQAGSYQVYRDLTDNGKGSVGCFNDCGRDGLKGNTTYEGGYPSYGFMSQGESDLSDDTMYNAACTYLGENRNITSNSTPQKTRNEQTVNYVSCHDNYTLYDQLNYCYNGGAGASGDSNPGVSDALLATTAFVLNSQGIAFIQGGEELLRQKVMKSDNPYWDTIDSGDYITLSDGNRLVRNSYAYGDEVNSYKWDRKITFNSFFKKYAEATNTRKTLVADGVLGADYDTVIQGTYGDNVKVSRLWGDMVDTSSGSHRAILAAQTEWSKLDATKKDVYVFLGGRMSGDSASIGCGSGTLKVLYSTSREAGSSITITNNSFTIEKYEMLIAERMA